MSGEVAAEDEGLTTTQEKLHLKARREKTASGRGWC